MWGDYLARYIRSQNASGGLTDWTVVLISNRRGDAPVELGGWVVHPVRRAAHPPEIAAADPVYSIRRLVSPTDESLDLTQAQERRALDLTKRQFSDDRSRHRAPPSRPSGPNIRRVRDPRNGLLLIYPLQEQDADGLPIVGFAASFPAAETDTPVDYVVNTVYWAEEFGS